MLDPATTAVSASNSLVDLATRVRTEREATVIALERSVEHAMAAGDLLIEAKRQLAHGQWQPWLTEHCALPDRTARLYMQLAKNRAAIENGNVADLTIRGAVALIALPRPSENAVVKLADQVARTAASEAVLAPYEVALAERAIRAAAIDEADRALKRIIKLADAQPGIIAIAESVWDEDELGDRLMSELADYTCWLKASFEVEDAIDPAPQATTAAITAKGLATEMLRRVTAAARQNDG